MTYNRATGATGTRSPRGAARMAAFFVAAIGALVLSSACAKRPQVATPAPPPTATGPLAQERGESGRRQPGLTPSASLPPGSELVNPPPTPPAEQPTAPATQATPKASPLKDIFFDFDASAIRPDAKATLESDADWLRGHPASAITIEGHCDERGTSEYNLGLGERRAQATKEYLEALGIDASRLTAVSYGKEHPFVLGHDESAWKWNRRDHLVTAKQYGGLARSESR